jgi:hypothetical protein
MWGCSYDRSLSPDKSSNGWLVTYTRDLKELVAAGHRADSG